MCDLDGDGYVDKRMFSMIKKELKFNDSSKRIGNMMDKISRQELITLIEDKNFIKQLKPFNLADYFKDYE
jgi:Ca2+-binding EF-hand superfamily protein